MLEKTDEQVGTILESIRNVTPEVVEQAVAYWRILDTVWLGIVGSVALIALIVCFRCWRIANRDGWSDSVTGEITGHGVAYLVFVFVGGIALLICAPIACDLAKICIAPDYYAVECIVEMGHEALGK